MNHFLDYKDVAGKRKAKRSSILLSLTVFLFFCLAAFIAFAVYLKHSRDELPLPAPTEEVKPQTDILDTILKIDLDKIDGEPIPAKPKEELSIERNPRIKDFINRLKTETDEEKLLAYVELYHKEKVDFNKLYEDETKYKRNAFHFVAQNLMVSVLKKMNELQPIDIEVLDGEGFSVLHAVAAFSEPKNGNEFQRTKETIEYLIEETEFDIDLFSAKNATPLMTAIWNDNIELVKILLELCASPHPMSYSDKLSPLDVAVMKHNVAVVELVLKYGADPVKLDMANMSPYHLAASLGHTDVMRLFLNDRKLFYAITGINANSENQSEWTALHFAASKNQYEMVKLLLIEYEIDDIPNQKDILAHDCTNSSEIEALFENFEEIRKQFHIQRNEKAIEASRKRKLDEYHKAQAESKAAMEAEILKQFITE